MTPPQVDGHEGGKPLPAGAGTIAGTAGRSACGTDEPPPVLGTWRRVYLFIAAYLVCLIALFTLFTVYFRY